MKRVWRYTGILIVVVIVVAGVSFFTWVPGYLAGRMNTVEAVAPYEISHEARQLHDTLRIVDLHSDLLLWSRDPLVRADYGHTDIPRLIEGNVALQVFGVVTKFPKGQNYERNTADSDRLTMLLVAQRWPRATWTSLRARAEHQAQKLRAAAVRSHGVLVLIESKSDLKRFLEQRSASQKRVAGLLSIEGLHALEGDLANIEVLYKAGYRMMGLTHFFDNEVAGSTHGEAKGGLTRLGVKAVRRMEKLGITIDLAHSSSATIFDVLKIASRPVVISHTGVQATCPGRRNLSDEMIHAIAANGGLIGIGFWKGAVCEIDPASVVRAIRHVVNLVGIDHIGLGSDFDGATHTQFDVTGLALITQALIEKNFTKKEVLKIMGENVIELLLKNLPESKRAF